MNPTFSGAEVFRLKDEQGLPLSVIFSLCNDKGLMIDWLGLFKAASAHGWIIPQTYDAIVEGFQDSGVWSDKRSTILSRLQFLILNHASLLQGD